jgi:hypothetical protein
VSGPAGFRQLFLAGLLGCANGRNYPDPSGPRYADSAAAGTVLEVHGASDHLAVWAIGILR